MKPLTSAALCLPFLLLAGRARAWPAEPPPAAAPAAEYRVGPLDVLGIEVFDNPDLTGQFTVANDGGIAYPLLGKVAVGERTVEEVKQLLTQLLKKDFLYDPIVSVTIKEYRSRQVTVLGDVGKPGVYFLDRPVRLLDVLSKAEGVATPLGKVVRGQTARIVRRSAAGEAQPTLAVDLHELLVEGKDSANPPMQDGDVVYVERSPSIHVIGEVKKPGSFPYEAGMTVLKAITLAGGATSKGSPKNAVIKRIQGAQEVKIKVKMQTALAPEDIVEVPLSFW